MNIDSTKLTNWYDFQAPFYHLWRDRSEGQLVKTVQARLGGTETDLCVLDAGCGTGVFSIAIARDQPSWKVTGMDLSSGMIGVAIKQANQLGLSNVRFLQKGVETIPGADGAFDLVLAAGLFPNLSQPDRVLKEFHRALRGDGRLFVLEFNRNSMSFFSRVFFRLMIFGYWVISRLVRKFRFADHWDIDSSTVDVRKFENRVTKAGFRKVHQEHFQSHILLEYIKQDS